MDLAFYEALPDAAEAVAPGAYGPAHPLRPLVFCHRPAHGAARRSGGGRYGQLNLRPKSPGNAGPSDPAHRAGNGETSLLVLSGDSHLPSVTLLRRQACTLIFETYSGLRVPKEALHVDEEGNTGVYILEGAVARWKPVEILYASSDDYVAALDQSSTDTLWPGDEILLGSNLYDGKVVYP